MFDKRFGNPMTGWSIVEEAPKSLGDDVEPGLRSRPNCRGNSSRAGLAASCASEVGFHMYARRSGSHHSVKLNNEHGAV